MTKSVMERKNSSDHETDNYFMIDPDTGCKDVVTKSLFIKQLKVIDFSLNYKKVLLCMYSIYYL